MYETIQTLNKDYGGDWFYNIETSQYEDYESEMMFLPEDV